MPMHWAKFDLAYHMWSEPIERFLAAAEGHMFRTTTALIGEVFHHAEPPGSAGGMAIARHSAAAPHRSDNVLSKTRRLVWIAGALALCACDAASQAPPMPLAETSPSNVSGIDSRQETGMWMTVGEQRFAITLDDTATTQAFSALLPLTLDMKELNGDEKYARLPKALPTKAVRPGQIRAGDLMLFGPDTLVVFYAALESSYSYTHIGRVDDPDGLADALGRAGVRVTFSRR